MSASEQIKALLQEVEGAIQKAEQDFANLLERRKALQIALRLVNQEEFDFGTTDEELEKDLMNAEGETSEEMRRRIEAIREVLHPDGRSMKFKELLARVNARLDQKLTRYQVIGAMNSPLGQEMFENSNIKGWWRLTPDYRTTLVFNFDRNPKPAPPPGSKEPAM